MLDERFLHLYFCQRLPMLQRGSSAIADLLVNFVKIVMLLRSYDIVINMYCYL